MGSEMNPNVLGNTSDVQARSGAGLRRVNPHLGQAGTGYTNARSALTGYLDGPALPCKKN